MMSLLSVSFIVTALTAILWAVFTNGPNQGCKLKDFKKYPHTSFNSSRSRRLVVLEKFMGIDGPETIIKGNLDETLYVGVSNGTIIKIPTTGRPESLVHIGGRPIGGAVDSSTNGIYLCVPPIGLVYISLSDSSVHVVSTISDDNLPLRFVDDAAVTSTGVVYFTDASEIAPIINQDGHYDVMSASLYDAMAGSGTGRLLRYDPRTKETVTLISGLNFANGVAISDDESFVLVAETFAFRILRYYIRGPRRGNYDVFVDALPGMPDGVSRATDGGFWVAIPTEVTTVFKLISGSRLLRYLFSHINRSLVPEAVKFGAIVKLDKNGKIDMSYVDPKGSSTNPITSVTEIPGALLIGSLRNEFIGVVNISW